MFHVEQMKKFFIFYFILALTACEKPNPHPELLDPIYSDLQSELAAFTAAEKSAKDDVEKQKLELKKLKPQSPSKNFIQNRIYESERKLNQITQRKTYLEFKIESRVKAARKSYFTAYKQKEKWPDPKEFDEYKLQKKLETAPIIWSHKKRLEEAGVGLKKPGSAKKEPSEH